MRYSSYKGMRWHKCNLHLHTAADSKHWLGDRLEEGKESVAAKDFAEACYQQKFDIIAVTDHNFLSKDFIPHLLAAFKDIERNFNHKITLFLGFEFEADVGKGIHVLCLFETTGISIEKIGRFTNNIDHILTLCGVEGSRIKDGRLTKSIKRLPEILNVVQKRNQDGAWQGIVIVPHVFKDSLFDNDRINEWLQQEEFRNPELLAIEVPKPVCKMSKSFQKLFRSGEDSGQTHDFYI